MATRRGVRDYQDIQASSEMQDDIQVLDRAVRAEENDPNGLVSKVKKLAQDLSHDGSKGNALYEKVATKMVADGVGSPRDAFPEIYADILEERNRLMEQQKEALDQAEATPEERTAWVAGQQYQEVDKDYQPGELTRENLSRLPEHQAAAEQRMGGIVQRLAKRAMDKVVDTMVAFDSSIDAVAAKSKSMWSSVTDAIKSKKTKLAALAATAIVAAGLTGSPTNAADIPQADAPTTHAEMMQSMHEGRMEHMEQDIQDELQRGMHEARADHMEQQLKQAAMDKFSSHLQSVKAEAVEEFSAGLDEAIEAAEKQFEYSYHILHSPAFQDAALSNPEVQDALMEDVEVRNAVRHSPDTQNLMMDIEENDVAMQVLLNDEAVKHRVAELPAFKRMLQNTGFVDEKTLDNDLFMSRVMDAKGVTESIISDPVVKMAIMGDEVIQDRALNIEEVKERAFSSPETKKRVLETSGVERILDTPEMEQRVMRDLGKEVALDLPEPEKMPKLDISQDELDRMSASVSQQDYKMDLPDRKERKIDLPEPEVRKLDLPEPKERSLDLPERKVRTLDVPEPKVRQFNAQFLKYMEADTITYNDLDQKLFDAGVETSVHIEPPATSNYDAKITAHDIQFMAGGDLSQLQGEIERNGSPEVTASIKDLFESAGIEWDTSGYDKDKDPNQFVVSHSAEKDQQKKPEDDMVMTSAPG